LEYGAGSDAMLGFVPNLALIIDRKRPNISV